MTTKSNTIDFKSYSDDRLADCLEGLVASRRAFNKDETDDLLLAVRDRLRPDPPPAPPRSPIRKYRVSCSDYFQTFMTLEAAQRFAERVNTAGVCKHSHTIEEVR